MMSTITNQGKLAFMVFTRAFTAMVMIEFLSRLMRQSKKPLFLIVDGHPVHRSKKVTAWLAEHSDRIVFPSRGIMRPFREIPSSRLTRKREGISCEGSVQSPINASRFHLAWRRMFRLPAYSPVLNPGELLNLDTKSNALGRRRPASQAEMIDDVRGYLRSTQKQPHIIRGFFREEHTAYAA